LKIGHEFELWHTILTFAIMARALFCRVVPGPVQKQAYLSERKFCILAQKGHFDASVDINVVLMVLAPATTLLVNWGSASTGSAYVLE
jgi:hypothetical protein